MHHACHCYGCSGRNARANPTEAAMPLPAAPLIPLAFRLLIAAAAAAAGALGFGLAKAANASNGEQKDGKKD